MKRPRYLVALLAVLTVAFAAQASQRPADTKTAGQPEREWTQGELQREIANLRTEFENLRARVEGSEEVAPATRERLEAVSNRIVELTAMRFVLSHGIPVSPVATTAWSTRKDTG